MTKLARAHDRASDLAGSAIAERTATNRTKPRSIHRTTCNGYRLRPSPNTLENPKTIPIAISKPPKKSKTTDRAIVANSRPICSQICSGTDCVVTITKIRWENDEELRTDTLILQVQYLFAIGNSSAGNSVMIRHPLSVTTTSSSMRAAE